MKTTHPERSTGRITISLIAFAFGLMTIKSGGSVLFLGDEFRQQAGNYVPFVLWFNFLAGFAYLAAGIGFWFNKNWAARLAALIAAASVLVFALLGLHIYTDGNYEMRTLIAMGVRCLVWILIALFSCHYQSRLKHK
ncbi:MAG: hypothetical protein IMF09_01665 [Proteobacteria bacterium]|nr:hypothetical protein [Pseudomonadota bacterium]